MKSTFISKHAVPELETSCTTVRELGSCAPVLNNLLCGCTKDAVETAMCNLLNEPTKVTA